MRGVELIVELLARRSITKYYTVTGGAIAPLLDAAHRARAITAGPRGRCARLQECIQFNPSLCLRRASPRLSAWLWRTR